MERNYWRRRVLEALHIHQQQTSNLDCGLAINPTWLPVLNQPSPPYIITLTSLQHYNTPVTITALINYYFLISCHPYTLTASDTHLLLFNESPMLSFVTAEEDLRIETSYPFNEVTAVFLLNNPHYHHTSHSDEPLSYHMYICTYLHTVLCVIESFNELFG